jgi:hypothetical protein
MSRTLRFADFLEVTGFEDAPFAWHLSGMVFDNYKEVVEALRGTQS